MNREYVEGALKLLNLALEGDPPTHYSQIAEGGKGFKLSTRSIGRLDGVNPDLIAVVQYAIRVTDVDFGITRTGGVRTRETQRDLVDRGKSGTMRSRHLTGHAVDIFAFVRGKATWEPVQILKIHDAFEAASAALGVPLRYGGDWDGDGELREKGENDLVHHELPRGVYDGLQLGSLSPRAADFLQSVS